MPSEDHTPLLSCPFCGEEGRIHFKLAYMGSWKNEEFSAGCRNRCFDGQTWAFATREEAAAAWNRRAGEAALVEALEAFVMPGFDLDDVRKRTDPATLRKIARAREVLRAAKGEGVADKQWGYCTDCENRTPIINGRCGCGSGRVIPDSHVAAKGEG